MSQELTQKLIAKAGDEEAIKTYAKYHLCDIPQEVIDDNDKIKHIKRYMQYMDDEMAEAFIKCSNICKFYDDKDESYYDMIINITRYCRKTKTIKLGHIRFDMNQMHGAAHDNMNYRYGSLKKNCVGNDKIFLDNREDNSEYEYADEKNKIKIEKKYVEHWRKQWAKICEIHEFESDLESDLYKEYIQEIKKHARIFWKLSANALSDDENNED